MAALHKSVATLRIFGDSLDPEELSRLLGCRPTKSGVKGQIRCSTPPEILHKSGSWLLDATPQMPANLDAQVVELFNRVDKDLALWESLTRDYDVDLFCGFFMTETDEGLEISAETIRVLSDRRIKVGFCIYAPLEDEPKV